MDIEAGEAPGNVTRVKLTGRLDAPGVDRIETRFLAHTVSAGRPAVVDLSGVSFVASMGLRMLISAAKALAAKGSRMVLLAPSPLVADVLEQAAIDQIIPVAADEAAALALLGA